MKITIVSPLFNAHATILQCIGGLKNQSFTDFEVIFVDSSPNSYTKEIIMQNSNYKLISSVKKLSSQSARNLGAKHAQGEILVFLDPDCIPDKDWLLNLYESFKKGYTVVGGSINCFPGNYWAGVAHIEKFWMWLPNGKSRILKMFPSANFSIKKKLFDDLGGFYEKYEAADIEFCYRIADQKIEMLFNSRAVVSHIHNIKFIDLIKLRYDRGKQYADMKINRMRWSKYKSLIYIISSPFVPWYNLIHWMFVCINRKYASMYFLSFPTLLLCEYTWYFGQNIYYAKHVIGKSL